MILDPEVQLWNEELKHRRENEKKQTITISIAAGNYDTEIIIDLINQAIQDFWVKYQESSIGFENLAYLQSIENECKTKKSFRYHCGCHGNLFIITTWYVAGACYHRHTSCQYDFNRNQDLEVIKVSL